MWGQQGVESCWNYYFRRWLQVCCNFLTQSENLSCSLSSFAKYVACLIVLSRPLSSCPVSWYNKFLQFSWRQTQTAGGKHKHYKHKYRLNSEWSARRGRERERGNSTKMSPSHRQGKLLTQLPNILTILHKTFGRMLNLSSPSQSPLSLFICIPRISPLFSTVCASLSFST